METAIPSHAQQLFSMPEKIGAPHAQAPRVVRQQTGSGGSRQHLSPNRRAVLQEGV